MSPVITGGGTGRENGRLRLIRDTTPFTTPEAFERARSGRRGPGGMRWRFWERPGLLLDVRDHRAGRPCRRACPPPPETGARGGRRATRRRDHRRIATGGAPPPPRLLGRTDPDYLIGRAGNSPPALPPLPGEWPLRPRAAGKPPAMWQRLTDSFSPQPDGLRAAVLRCWGALHRSCRHRAGPFRAAPRDVPPTLRAVGLPLRTLIAALAVEVTMMAILRRVTIGGDRAGGPGCHRGGADAGGVAGDAAGA